MKKFLSVLLVIACLAAAFSAEIFADDTITCASCGRELPADVAFCSYCGKPVVKDGEAPKAVVTGSDEKGNLRIDFGENGINVFENELITIRVMSFYEDVDKRIEYVPGSDVNYVEYREKYFEVKVHNNSEKEYLFNLFDCYVGDDDVTLIDVSGGNTGPAPGKNKTYKYCVDRHLDNPKIPLENLRDLYDFEFELNLSVFNNAKNLITDTIRQRVRFADKLRGVTEEIVEDPAIELSELEAVLVGSRWVNDTNGVMSYMRFEEDGTGEFYNGVFLFKLSWNLDGNTINELLVYGDSTANAAYELQEKDGGYVVVNQLNADSVWYPAQK